MRPSASPDPRGSRPLLVFSDDWGRHPSSSQHLVRRLLTHREVLWVNTIGTRSPRLDVGTAKRIAEKLGQWLPDRREARRSDLGEARNGRPRSLDPKVVSPRMWPSFGSPWARRLNRRLLSNALIPLIDGLPERPTAITTLPIIADLVSVLPVHRWIYYCVDDFSQWPGYDGATIRDMERELVTGVDRVVAASEALVQGMVRLGATADLLTHGVDLDLWRGPARVAEALRPPADGARGRQIVFWGVVDRRMDVGWIEALSNALVSRGIEGRILLVGPREDPDRRLANLPRVEVQPPIPYAELPGLAAEASVLIMPYADLPVTRAMQPLKLKEYLATGRPTVVRALPATTPWADACDVCDTPEMFVDRVIERLRTGAPREQLAARQALEAESWDMKALRFSELLDATEHARIAIASPCSATA